MSIYPKLDKCSKTYYIFCCSNSANNCFILASIIAFSSSVWPAWLHLLRIGHWVFKQFLLPWQNNHLTARNKSPTIRNINNQIHISTPKNESISYSALLNFATLIPCTHFPLIQYIRLYAKLCQKISISKIIFSYTIETNLLKQYWIICSFSCGLVT